MRTWKKIQTWRFARGSNFSFEKCVQGVLAHVPSPEQAVEPADEDFQEDMKGENAWV